MKILILTHEYPPVGGGGGRVAKDIATRMAKEGHRVIILTSAFGDLSTTAVEDDLTILKVWAGRKEAYYASFFSMLMYIASAFFVGLKIIRDEQLDVIHVHFAVPAGAAAWALSKISRVPYIMTVHLGDVPGGTPEKTDNWFRWVYPLTHPIWHGARKIIAVSNYTRQLATQHYDSAIQVIPNGVDVKALRPRKRSANKIPRIVFAGRFVYQKNPLRIIETLYQLRDKPWQCTMIGDGPLFLDVYDLVKKYDMEDRFVFTGWITPEEVLKWLDDSDILFMPSYSEGLPVVGVQALAKGLAIVAGYAGGFVDVIDEGKNGFLVRNDEPDVYVDVLRSLLDDPKELEAFQRNSLIKADIFDLDRIVAGYLEVIREVTGKS